MNADDRDPYDFGLRKIGTWDSEGFPKDWHVDGSLLAYDLPRWLLNEPVLTLTEGPACCVYLRGIYSDRLTCYRKEALIKAGGVAALLKAKELRMGRVER